MLLCPGPLAWAHLLDVYLQTTQVTIHPDRVVIGLELAPGMQIAPALLKTIDTDGDGRLSDQETAAYARRVFEDLHVSLDGRPLSPTLSTFRFPSREDLSTGYGAIHLEVSAPVSALNGGRHVLVYANGFRPPATLYLANAMLPQDDRIKIVAQQRDAAQDTLTVTYDLAPARRSIVLVGAIGGLLAACAGAWRIRSRKSKAA